MAVTFDAAYAVNGLSAYASVHHPEHVTIVDDPVLGARRKVARLETHNTDLGPTANPRTQLDPPRVIQPESDYWYGFGVYFPDDWPDLPAGAWLTLAEVYGPPYAGSSPFRLAQVDGRLAAIRNATFGSDTVWSLPLRRGIWHDFALHSLLTPDPELGFYSIWLNTGGGWQRQFYRHFQTQDGSNGGGANGPQLKNYRKVDVLPDPHACYFAAHRVGTSNKDVDPRSYG